jgi:hypothetical protein
MIQAESNGQLTAALEIIFRPIFKKTKKNEKIVDTETILHYISCHGN